MNPNPPGKLLAEIGHPLPGPLGAFGVVYGKLKITGKKAEQLLGFKPKKGAIGVVLSRHKYKDKNGKMKRGIFVSSLMPHKQIYTDKAKASIELMTVISKIMSQHKKDIIYPIWNPLVQNSKKWKYGWNYFMSVNMKRIGTSPKWTSFNWKNLLISDGKLEPPSRIYPNWYDPDKKEINIILPIHRVRRSWLLSSESSKDKIGIGIFDKITNNFYHIPPGKASPGKRVWNLPHSPQKYRFYIYMYYRQPNLVGQASRLSKEHHSNSSFGFRHSEFNYSPSISNKIRPHRHRKDAYNRSPIIISIKE